MAEESPIRVEKVARAYGTDFRHFDSSSFGGIRLFLSWRRTRASTIPCRSRYDRPESGHRKVLRAEFFKSLFLFGFISLFLVSPICGAGVPSTWNSGHPRLPYPDNNYLLGLYNSAEMVKYNTAASNWDSTNPGSVGSTASVPQFRRLLIAYLANNAGGNTALATADLAKIKQLADLGGTWGKLIYKVNDGIGTGTYTLTSPSANFLTGCYGGSCAGQFLSIRGRTYNIASVVNANTVTLSTSNPAPSGTNLQVRVFDSNVGLQGYVGIRLAMAYDWIYGDLDAATRTAFLNQLETVTQIWEENYIGIDASPYNDVQYIRYGLDGMISAFAIYPDFDIANPTGGACQNPLQSTANVKPCGTYHINFAMNKLFNVFMPVWHQVFGDNGGGWHEDWSGYVDAGNGPGLARSIVPTLLSWQSASGDPVFQENPWLQNFPRWLIYVTRPDFTMQHIGEVAAGTLTSEYQLTYGYGASLGSLSGLAEIYDDPVARGWARIVNREYGANHDQPTGFEPSAWPFYSPDNTSKAVASRSSLPTSKNLDGWGVIDIRSGWGESDTDVTLKYGDSFWSHTHADAGSFTISHRGNLAISSGTYRAGSNSEHEIEYGRQTISQNSLLIVDPNDTFPNQEFCQITPPGAAANECLPLSNDGGQRRSGTFYNQLFPQYSSPDCLDKATAPDCVYDWQSEFKYYHMGSLLAYQSTSQYTYAAIDITPAYQVPAGDVPNAVNRTNRANSVIRNLLFIRRSTDGYVIIYDAVDSANPAFTKKWLLHSINQPVISGNRYEIDRTENVEDHGAGDWTQAYGNFLNFGNSSGSTLKYQYDGKLVGWMVTPSGGNIKLVGGAGKEFWVADPASPGSGTNWSGCMGGSSATANSYQWCASPYWQWATLTGMQETITPNPSVGLVEPGSWRIEESPSTQENQDYFLNVMLATNYESANVPASVNSTSDATHIGATWSDSGNTYTVTFNKSGSGGHVTITGATNVNADLIGGSTTGGGAPASLSSLSCSTSSLTPAAASTCTVTLSQAAGTGGITVTLSSSAQALTVPSSVLVASGATTATFVAVAGTISSNQTALITATFNGALQTTSLSLQSAQSGMPTLASLSCSTPSLASGLSSTCTVSLSQPAGPSGVSIAISTNLQILTVPTTIAVPAGSSSATFGVSASVISIAQPVSVTATLNGISKVTSLNLVPTSPSGGMPIPTGNWTMAPTNGPPESVVGYDNMVYAPGPKKFLMWNNYHNVTSETNEALWAYDFATNRWDILGLNGNFHSEQLPESGHEVGMLQWNPAINALINYCCFSGSQGYERSMRTWIFDPIGLTGRDKQTPTRPGNTDGASAAFDTADNVYVLFDRILGTWTYDVASNNWTKKTTNGVSPSATTGYMGAMAYNSVNNKIYLFGGLIRFISGDASANSYSNDLFTYDVPSNTWTKLSPSGPLPSGREFPAFAYDSTNNVFLMVGGQDTTGYINDTWIYDPAANRWTKLNPAQLPSPILSPAYQRLAYDGDDNVFVMTWAGTGGYLGGGSANYAAQTWFFRYAGTGPNVGYAANPTFTATPGSINRNPDGWANEPVLASTGSNLYAGWIETGRPFDTSSASPAHPFVSRFSASAWSALGSSFAALDSEFGGNNESHAPSMTMVGTTPWISWYKTSSTGQLLPNSLYAKYWNGSSWVGGAIGSVNGAATSVGGRSALTSVGGIPYLGFIEVNRSCFGPWCDYLYVKSWNGSSWNLAGPGALNRNASTSAVNSQADSLSMASDGTTPFVAWTEHTMAVTQQSDSPPQVYVDHWNGSTWVALGGSLNVNPSNFAYDVSIAYLSGQPYVAWVERSQADSNELYVKTWNGTTWSLVGSGSLNKDTSIGWAFRPTLIADPNSNSLYLAWVEQQNLGQKAQVYVSRYSAGAWISLGDSLNADPQGSAERVSLAILNGQPVAAWGEVKSGTLRQIYVKQWNSSTWTLLPRTTQTAPSSCDLNGDGVVNVADVQLAISQSIGALPCTTADLQQNGKCTVIDVQRVLNAALDGSCVIGP